MLGTIAFAIYLFWNAYWLVRWTVPPSILLGVFGVPAPTTGMTRSTLALLRGDMAASLFWNPFTLPILGLLVHTVLELGTKWLRGRPVLCSRPLVLAWLAVLLAAWGAKVLIGPESW